MVNGVKMKETYKVFQVTKAYLVRVPKVEDSTPLQSTAE